MAQQNLQRGQPIQWNGKTLNQGDPDYDTAFAQLSQQQGQGQQGATAQHGGGMQGQTGSGSGTGTGGTRTG